MGIQERNIGTDPLSDLERDEHVIVPLPSQARAIASFCTDEQYKKLHIDNENKDIEQRQFQLKGRAALRIQEELTHILSTGHILLGDSQFKDIPPPSRIRFTAAHGFDRSSGLTKSSVLVTRQGTEDNYPYEYEAFKVECVGKRLHYEYNCMKGNDTISITANDKRTTSRVNNESVTTENDLYNLEQAGKETINALYFWAEQF